MMKSILRKAYRKLFHPIFIKLEKIEAGIELNRILIAQGRIEDLIQAPPLHNLADAEFRVFSQWGEDGIIQLLLSKIPIPKKVFVEFGVEDYHESNTRFLLMNNYWSGLVIDCDEKSVEKIRAKELYWRYELTAVCAFVTKENINQLIENAGIVGDIGILSIDIDGNDYWIWEAINIIWPRIVIIEYNSLFGNRHLVTIPYNEQFIRSKAHYSNLYYGASLPALCHLAQAKGYVFVGSNKAGNNAFFVREDLSPEIQEIINNAVYVESRIRESRNNNGDLSFAAGKKRIELIENEVLLDLESGKLLKIKDL